MDRPGARDIGRAARRRRQGRGLGDSRAGAAARPAAHGSGRWSALGATATGVALILAAWAVAARLIGASIILPTPLETIRSLWSQITLLEFYLHLSATLARALLGFGIAFVLGLAWGLLAGMRRGAGSLLRPALVLIRATPVIAVILLALIWFRSTLAPIFVTWLMVLPVIVENVATGARTASGELLEMAHVFRVPRHRRVRDLTLPALRPYLFASAHSGMGMAFKVTVAAEVLVQPARALGGAMQEARFYLDTPRILAITISVIALSAVAEALLRLFERLVPGYRRLRTTSAAAGAGPHLPADAGSEPGPLCIDHLSRLYDEHIVLHDLSLRFDPGEVTVVLGPSGCGKTTLLRLIARLDDPDEGRVGASGTVSLAFQEPRLLPWADAAANLGFVAPGRISESEAARWLGRVRLSGEEHSLPSTLSGGMQQRLALSRALAYPSRTLLLDEPFQNLDLAVKLDLARLVRRLTSEDDRVTVMVTHDVVEALATGDRIVILAAEPARVIGSQTVELSEEARDPRSADHQRTAAVLYDLLLSAR
jgi:NitT/TauT family transport system permease protein